MDREQLLDWMVDERFAKVWMELYQMCEMEQGKKPEDRQYPRNMDIVSFAGISASTAHRWIQVLKQVGFKYENYNIMYDFERESPEWYIQAKKTLEAADELNQRPRYDYTKKINPLPKPISKIPRLPRQPLDKKSLPIAAIKKAMIDIMDDENIRKVQHADIVNYVMKQGHNLIPIEEAIEEMKKAGDIYELKEGEYKLTDME